MTFNNNSAKFLAMNMKCQHVIVVRLKGYRIVVRHRAHSVTIPTTPTLHPATPGSNLTDTLRSQTKLGMSHEDS